MQDGVETERQVTSIFLMGYRIKKLEGLLETVKHSDTNLFEHGCILRLTKFIYSTILFIAIKMEIPILCSSAIGKMLDKRKRL